MSEPQIIAFKGYVDERFAARPWSQDLGYELAVSPQEETVDTTGTDAPATKKITIASRTSSSYKVRDSDEDCYVLSVAVAQDTGASDKLVTRDCVLTLDLSERTEKSLSLQWGDSTVTVHPRISVNQDLTCELGMVNVFWITEYALNKFVVSRWTEPK